MNLDDIRQEINQVDAKLVTLLEERMRLVTKVSDFKKETGKATLDEAREQAILDRVSSLIKQDEFEPFIRETFKAIMKESRRYQESKKDGEA